MNTYNELGVVLEDPGSTYNHVVHSTTSDRGGEGEECGNSSKPGKHVVDLVERGVE